MNFIGFFGRIGALETCVMVNNARQPAHALAPYTASQRHNTTWAGNRHETHIIHHTQIDG